MYINEDLHLHTDIPTLACRRKSHVPTYVHTLTGESYMCTYICTDLHLQVKATMCIQMKATYVCTD
jgi:hypothetical protein